MNVVNTKQVSIHTIHENEHSLTFSATVKPIYKERFLGVFGRDDQHIRFEKYTKQAYQEHIIELSPILERTIEKADNSETQRLFYAQTQLVKDQPRFLSIADFRATTDEEHYDHILNLAFNPSISNWGQNKDFFIKLLPGNEVEIYRSGKLLDPHHSKEYVDGSVTNHDDPYDVVKHALNHMVTFRNEDLFYIRYILLFSDTHIGDGTLTDNFGPLKGKYLQDMFLKLDSKLQEREMKLLAVSNKKSDKTLEERVQEKLNLIMPQLEAIKNVNNLEEQQTLLNNVLCLCPGDLLELWQAVFEHVRNANPELWEVLRRLKNFYVIPGNHDEDIYKKEDVRKWFEEMLPNAKIVPFFYYNFKKFTLIVDHGHDSDNFNVNSGMGKVITKVAARVEMMLNKPADIAKSKNSTEQKMEGGARAKLLPTRTSINNEMISPFNAYNIKLAIHEYVNRDKPVEEKPKTVIYFKGHTHDMFELMPEKHPPEQEFEYEYLRVLYNKPGHAKFYVGNDGAGSGLNLNDELKSNRKKYKRRLGMNLDDVHARFGAWQQKDRESLRQDWVIIDVDRKEIAYNEEYSATPVFKKIR